VWEPISINVIGEVSRERRVLLCNVFFEVCASWRRYTMENLSFKNIEGTSVEATGNHQSAV
jgi:hypothetical protein